MSGERGGPPGRGGFGPGLRGLLFLGWGGGFFVALCFVFYGLSAHQWVQLLDDHTSPGTVSRVLVYTVRLGAYGLVATLFFLEVRVRPGDPPAAAPGLLGDRLRRASDRASIHLLLLTALGAVREVMDHELCETRFGEGFYRGPWEALDLVEAPLLTGVALAVFLAMRPDPAPPGGQGRPDAATRPGRAAAGAASLLLVFTCLRVLAWPHMHMAQDRHFEHLTVQSFTWQILVVAMLLTADDPLRAGWTDLGRWTRRNLAPLRLLAMLELFAIVAREEWYLELVYVHPRLTHGWQRLMYYPGNWDNLAVSRFEIPATVGVLVLIAVCSIRAGRVARAAVD